VRFVLTYVLADAFTGLRERPMFTLPGEATVVLALEQVDEDPRDPSKSVVILTATVDLEPPPKTQRALRQLAAGELPDGTKASAARIGDSDDDPSPPRFDELPGSLREFSRELSDVLASALVRTYEVIRWRYDIHGMPRPYSSRGIQWSDDLAAWHHFPGETSIHVSMHRTGTPLDAERADKVDALLKAGTEEPLAHYMLREARVSFGRQNVSALVMAMAAAEIGLKQLISQLVPGATWLAENAPTPPIVRMLIEYVPLLPRVQTDPPLVPPPISILDALRKGVTMRNSAAHVGARALDHDDVEEVMEAVQDLLWLFDYYAGHRWALEHLSHEKKVEMGLREPNND
jgi:hypothetical protein